MKEDKEHIITIANGKLVVPNKPIIPLIKGDGIGPDVVNATITVMDKAIQRMYSGERKVNWKEYYAGETAKKKFNEWLPKETIESIKNFTVALKGPLTTPIGEGFRSLNVTLRQELDLYACVRPVKYIHGVPSRLRNPEELDVVIFRENTEDVYAGIEYEVNTSEVEKVRDFLNSKMGAKIRSDSSIGIKPISEFATKRIARAAINYALNNKRRNVTIVHKGNIMKFTEGRFRKWSYEVAENEFRDSTITEAEYYSKLDSSENKQIKKLLIKDRIADNMMQQMILRTKEYDVLVLPNLNGDYISDLAAALAGGLGMAPGANINYETGRALFEPTHGTAPKYANKDVVNPSSTILSGIMMLNYLGWRKAADSIENSITKCINEKIVTYDLARQMPGIKPVKTSEFAEQVVKNIK